MLETLVMLTLAFIVGNIIVDIYERRLGAKR